MNLRQSFAFSESDIVFVSVCRLSEEKNIEESITHFASIHKKKSETNEDSAPIRTVEKKQTAQPAEKKPLAEKKTTAETPKEPAQRPTVSAPKEENVSPEKKFQAPSEEQLANEFAFKADLKKSGASKGKTMLVDLDNHTCRWPIGDPKDENFHFCGKKVKIGQTYCEEHAAIAYVKPNKKITFV